MQIRFGNRTREWRIAELCQTIHLFTGPALVRTFFPLLPEGPLTGISIVALDSSTAETLCEFGAESVILPQEPTLSGRMEAVEQPWHQA